MKEFFIRRYRIESGQADPRRTLIRIDDAGIITFVDSQAEAVLGFGASTLVGQPVSRLVAAREDDPLTPANRQRFERGHSVLVTLRHREGFFFTAQLTLRLAVRDADQAVSAFVTLRDSLPLDPRLLALTEKAVQLGFWELDIQDNRMSWSEGLYRLLGLRPGSDITPEQALFYCQGGQNRLRAMFRRCARTGEPFDATLDLVNARQQSRRIRVHGQALKQGLQVTGLSGVVSDLSPQRELASRTTRGQALLSALMAATDDLVVAVDTGLNLLCCNSAFRHQARETFGVEVRDGDNLCQLLAEFPNERRLVQRLWQRAFERESFTVEMPLAMQDRELPVYELRYQRLLDEEGEVLGAVQVARDVSDRTRVAGNRRYMNRHDPITGLLNQREFGLRLARLLRNTCDSAGRHGLLYFNLDGFTELGERAPPGTGDRYLRALAGEMMVRIRQRDSLARLSGDTFALLIENCDRIEAAKVADTLLTLIADFVFQWQDVSLQTTASAGLLRLHGECSQDPEKLLEQAADLCHTAKTAGRNRLHAADAVSDEVQAGLARGRLEALRESLDNDRLELQFQSLRPVASVTWGDHIEILARLRSENPDEPVLEPAEFLPLAERFDLARDIDRAVIRKTLAWLARHSLLEPRLKYCGFNLSLASVLDDSFPDFMATLLRDLPFAPECFCLEIRETTASQYPDEVTVLCDALHRIGCRVALDGAGASVASYSLAATLPVDIIKLDQAMMAHLHDDPVQQVMVEALHKIAAAAGKATVATFIENDEALRKVRSLGIHYGQGFRLSRPRPLEELRPGAGELDTGRIGG